MADTPTPGDPNVGLTFAQADGSMAPVAWSAPPVGPAPGSPPPSSSPSGAGWGVREQRNTAPSLLPALPPTPSDGGYIAPAPPSYGGAPGGGPPGGMPPQYGSTPWSTPSLPRRRGGLGRGIGGVGAVVLIIGIKVFIGFAAGGAIKAASTATDKAYHVPLAIGAATKSSDPAVQTKVDQLTAGFQMPSLQNAHSEGAGYVDSTQQVAYVLSFGQDNAGRNEPRSGITLADLGGNSSTAMTTSDSGVTVSCQTDSSIQECVWYNANASGVFFDLVDATPAAAASTLMPTLKAIVS